MEMGLLLLLLLVMLALSLFVYGLFLLLRGSRGTGLVASVTAVALMAILAWLTAYTFGPFLFGLALVLAASVATISSKAQGSSRGRRPR